MTPAEIATTLTEAQREAVLGATDLMSHHGGYAFFAVRHTGEAWPEGMATFLTLHEDRLTPLGLAVRAILMEQDNGNA